MTNDTSETEKLPFDKAVARIKKSRSKKLYLEVGVWFDYKVQNPAKPTHQGAKISGLVEVTRRQLVNFLVETVPDHWRPQLLVSITTKEHCIFVGTAP